MITRVEAGAILPVHEGFRELEVPDAFTWEDGIIETTPSGGCTVAFWSLRNLSAGADKIDRLLELDNDAFEEAKTMPGFHTYWRDDELSSEGLGLSFCLWDSAEDAHHAALQPKHMAAVRYIYGEGKDVYHDYRLKVYQVSRFAGRSVLFEERPRH